MVKRLDGITQCESLGLDPHDVFSNQFLISKDVAYGLGVFDQEQIGAWTFSHGKKLIFHVLTDSRGRAFGVFIGVGVDADGEFVTADSFAGFNPSARNFWSRIEDYMSGIAGRYTVFLTAQDKSRCYFDPVAHLTTLFNAKTGIVASSAFLAIDRPLQGNEKFHHRAIHGRGAPEGAEGNYILGHSVDEDVRFALPNHRLDMDSFELTRVWPMSSSFKQIDADGLEDVMQQLVLRQKQILNALVLKIIVGRTQRRNFHRRAKTACAKNSCFGCAPAESHRLRQNTCDVATGFCRKTACTYGAMSWI